MMCAQCPMPRPRIQRARYASGNATFVATPVARVDIDDAGEPRVIEGTTVVIGREPFIGADR